MKNIYILEFLPLSHRRLFRINLLKSASLIYSDFEVDSMLRE